MIRAGSRVTLANTGNDHLPDGTPAVVTAVESWGAHIQTSCTATGRYRAGWSEMCADVQPESTGYTCDACGGCNLVQAGVCMLCRDCGTTSGCS